MNKITESAMKGELNFTKSLIKRVSLLEGLDESVMIEIAENLPLTEGAKRLFRTLKKYGFKTAILSGGFTYFVKYLQNKLGIDYMFANQLEIVNGKLTGRLDQNKIFSLLWFPKATDGFPCWLLP